MLNKYKDIVHKYYDHLPDDPYISPIEEKVNVCSFNPGVGDSLMTYQALNEQECNGHTFFPYNRDYANEFLDFNAYISTSQISEYKPILNICDIQTHIKTGGHFLQKVQKILGLTIQEIPKPKLTTDIATIKNRVVMTFDRGAHGANQTHLHPRPRLLYPEHQESIQQFINQNKNKYEFIEVGKNKSILYNIEDKTNLGIKATAEIIASCDFFFGMHNGLMHIAAGLDKKSIIIVNFPEVNHLVLPMLKRSSHPDMDWLYPQNVHLHQDGSSILVPHLSYTNIQLAFDGEIYPFFTHMHEHINKE